jgi:hypothetical protein
MMAKTCLSALLALLALAGCAGPRADAVMAHGADLGTTGLGLALGAAEANPLGIVALGVKAYSYEQIERAPAVEQPRLWGIYGAFGWAATANNVCVIAAMSTGGVSAAFCPVFGLASGAVAWLGGSQSRERAAFEAICTRERVRRPELTCVWRAA